MNDKVDVLKLFLSDLIDLNRIQCECYQLKFVNTFFGGDRKRHFLLSFIEIVDTNWC